MDDFGWDYLFFQFFFTASSSNGFNRGNFLAILVAVGFLGYVRQSIIPIALVLCLSVIQRETIPFVFGVFGAVGLIFHENKRRFNWLVLLLSVASFLTYMLIRLVLNSCSWQRKPISNIGYRILTSIMAPENNK